MSAIRDCTACIHTETVERAGGIGRRCTKHGFWTGDTVMNCSAFKAVDASSSPPQRIERPSEDQARRPAESNLGDPR